MLRLAFAMPIGETFWLRPQASIWITFWLKVDDAFLSLMLEIMENVKHNSSLTFTPAPYQKTSSLLFPLMVRSAEHSTWSCCVY